jgi:tetratricopeptide (TPR) repeat protein
MNNNQRCPRCNSFVSMRDKFCPRCGFRFQKSKNDLEILKEHINGFYEIGTMIESSNLFNDKERFPLISPLKVNPNSNISKIFLDDFFIFLSILGISDGVLHDNEVTFINYIFNSNWTKLDLVPMIEAALKTDLTGLPLSFMVLHELDVFRKEEDNSNLEQTELLFIDYEMMGKLFISIDGNIDREEVNVFNNYMSNLRGNLNKFKLIEYPAFTRASNSEDNGGYGNNFGFSNKTHDTSNQNVSSYEKEEETEQELLDKGIKQLEYENYQEAENALKKVVKINPNNDLAWNKLCVLYRNINNNSEALKSINRAIEIDSTNAQYWFNKGDTLFWSGNFEESIICFDNAIELDPDECDDALAIKGMALIRLNKMSDGELCLAKSLGVNPKNELALSAIKRTDALKVGISQEDEIRSLKENLPPELCAKLRMMSWDIGSLQQLGIDIEFEFNRYGKSRLKHGSKEYFFNVDELEGAQAYISLLSSEKMAENVDFSNFDIEKYL